MGQLKHKARYKREKGGPAACKRWLQREMNEAGSALNVRILVQYGLNLIGLMVVMRQTAVYSACV